MRSVLAHDTVSMSGGYAAAEIEVVVPRVYRLLLALGARVGEAEDATQDAAERALGSKSRIERLDAWLYVVASRRWRQSRMRARLFRPLEWARAAVPAPSADRVTLLGE